MSSNLIFFALVILALMSLLMARTNSKKRAKPEAPGNDSFNIEAAEELSPQQIPYNSPAVEIPLYYHDLRLNLLVRDPEWLYAYWEINPDHWEATQKSLGKIAHPENMALRIVEFANDMAYFDIKVGNLVGDWHIQVAKPNTPYYALIGLISGDDFFPLVVSNVVTTPRNDYSPLTDEEWMLVSDYERKMVERIGSIPFDATSPFMFRKDAHNG